MKRIQPADRKDYYPTVTEVAVACLTAVVVGVFVSLIAAWSQDRPVPVSAVVITVLVGSLLVWFGRKSLRRLRVWTLAGKSIGGVLLAIGLMTAITGQRPEGRYKIRREVDRDADLPKIILGLVLIGSSLWVEASWRKRREDATRTAKTNAKKIPRGS